VQPQKILIVDDENTILDLISELLNIEGYYIEKALNGQEALEKYKLFSPDIVIMDIEMPVMDGYESSSRIKSFDPEAKILVLTGNPNDSRAQRTLKEGIAFNLLKKPVRLKDLTQIIRENLPSS